jgi:hypothetical protein
VLKQRVAELEAELSQQVRVREILKRGFKDEKAKRKRYQNALQSLEGKRGSQQALPVQTDAATEVCSSGRDAGELGSSRRDIVQHAPTTTPGRQAVSDGQPPGDNLADQERSAKRSRPTSLRDPAGPEAKSSEAHAGGSVNSAMAVQPHSPCIGTQETIASRPPDLPMHQICARPSTNLDGQHRTDAVCAEMALPNDETLPCTGFEACRVMALSPLRLTPADPAAVHVEASMVGSCGNALGCSPEEPHCARVRRHGALHCGSFKLYAIP